MTGIVSIKDYEVICELRQVKKTLALTITIVLLLCSCGQKVQEKEELAMDIRANFLASETVNMTALVTADYGDRVYEFKMTYTGTGDAGDIKILSPEEIAGLMAHVSATDGTIEYDGAELYTGALTEDGLSPAGAIPVLIGQWRGGYIKTATREKLGETETLCIATDISDTVSQNTWFDTESLVPLRSELYNNGQMVVSCQFADVVLK